MPCRDWSAFAGAFSAIAALGSNDAKGNAFRKPVLRELAIARHDDGKWAVEPMTRAIRRTQRQVGDPGDDVLQGRSGVNRVAA